MHKYISLLRGINIGGRNIIKMEALRQSYANIGLSNVQSYIQSGNLTFESALDAATLSQQIKNVIAKDFGFDVPTLVKNAQDFANICAANPLTQAERDGSELHIVFLAEPNADDASMQQLAKLRHKTEELAWHPEAVFLFCPNGYHKSKLHNNYLEAQLKTVATTRNWRSCQKILDMLQ